MKQRHHTREESLELRRQLTKWMKLGRIRESSSESAVGTLFILKKDGSKRLCMDYRPVNKETVGDENKAPLQDVNRDRFRGANYFTRLDTEDGYHQLWIREGDEKHTAFITEFGLYEWVVVCFGLKNASAVFGRYMTHVLREFIGDFVVVYFDDIVIYSKPLEEHREHVNAVLRKIEDEQITFKIKKCEFEVPETEYLGHMMSGETTGMLEDKVKHILEWPEPTTLKHIEQFRGLAGYYRQFIEKFSEKMKPLNECLREKQFRWTQKEQMAFKKIKEEFAKGTILQLFDYEKPIEVQTDASDYAISGTISQPTNEGKWKPVLFYSRKLTPPEMNYATPDKEMLAIVQMMKKFQHYLRDTRYPLIVKTEHRNLQSFMITKELNARQARWAEELVKYKFVIKHIKGK